jgi:hemolysin activation/secretion protein
MQLTFPNGEHASVTLQGDLTDSLLGGGVTSSLLTLTNGRVDLSRIALDLQTDQLGARTQGHYTRFNLTLSRMQRIDERNSLWASFSAQAANRNLDAGEKFALGGPQGVRAFPLLEGTGDEGSLLSLAWRYQWSRNLRFETFYDTGRVRRSKMVYPGAGTPDRYTLDGAGFSVDWSPSPAWRLSAVVAQRLSDNPAALPDGRDSDGTKRQQRVWVNASFSF